MSDYPTHDEPLTSVGFYAADSQRYGGVGWVVIAWRPHVPWMAHVIGPFPDQTKARAYGRKHYPRRYKVAGIHGPKP